ncbi:MAG: flagellar motor protein MotB [Acidobacteriota bacterium]
MRRRSEENSDSHDRWLISYADFITLLFAFFVVMFASSQTDRGKVGEAVRRAFNGEARPRAQTVLGGTVDDFGQGNRMLRGPGGREIYSPVSSADLIPSQAFLNRELAKEIADGKLTIHMEARGMVVSLSEAGYFVSGSDGLSEQGYPVLAKIAETILKTSSPVRLEGHTDAVPISTPRFRNNWELSSARGIATLNAFHNQFNVPLNRMAVTGYADTYPIDSNDTEEGRGKNRRVDIVILSQSGASAEPNAKPHD